MELLVAMGMLGIFSMFAAGLVFTVQDLLRKTGLDVRVDELHANIMLNLSDFDACTNTFRVVNYTGAPVAVTNIMDRGFPVAGPPGAVKFVTGGGPYSGNISIVSMEARNFVFTNPDIPAPFTGKFDFRIGYRYTMDTGTIRNVFRSLSIKTAPVAWAAGSPLAQAVPGCTASAGVAFGYDIIPYISRNVSDVKTNNLTINGDLTVVGITLLNSNFFTSSDKRLKKDFLPIATPFEKMGKIQGYSFVWKDSNRQDSGFLAQQVEQEFPEIVMSDKVTHVKKIQYNSLIPVLAESSKELKKNSDELSERIELLKSNLIRKIKKSQR